MRHPGPWKLGALSYIRTPDCKPIARILTDDPETRAILTHAAEMWEALKRIVKNGESWETLDDAADGARPLVDKINAEIAAAKGDGT